MQMPGGHLLAAGLTAATHYIPASREWQSSPVAGTKKAPRKGCFFGAARTRTYKKQIPGDPSGCRQGEGKKTLS